MQHNDRLRNKSFDSCLHFWHDSVSSELLTVSSESCQYSDNPFYSEKS
jgi:hypothetical protein